MYSTGRQAWELSRPRPAAHQPGTLCPGAPARVGKPGQTHPCCSGRAQPCGCGSRGRGSAPVHRRALDGSPRAERWTPARALLREQAGEDYLLPLLEMVLSPGFRTRIKIQYPFPYHVTYFFPPSRGEVRNPGFPMSHCLEAELTRNTRLSLGSSGSHAPQSPRAPGPRTQPRTHSSVPKTGLQAEGARKDGLVEKALLSPQLGTPPRA